jgi:hypothetical protein
MFLIGYKMEGNTPYRLMELGLLEHIHSPEKNGDTMSVD